MLDPGEIRAQVEKIRWFHSIDLGHGIITPGRDASAKRLARIALPASLAGRTVLDVGAWDGFFSFEAERRGARRVLAVDSYCWDGGGWGTQQGFNLARQVLGSRVEDRRLEVLELAPERVGTFDVVLFLGVLYHMKDPQAALARVASVAADLLIIDTHVDLLDIEAPAVAFYPGAELENDPSNWCGPNLSALEWMLRDAGFGQLERVFERPRWRRSGRAAWLALQGKSPFTRAYRRGRVVYHARKGRLPA